MSAAILSRNAGVRRHQMRYWLHLTERQIVACDIDEIIGIMPSDFDAFAYAGLIEGCAAGSFIEYDKEIIGR